MQKAIICVTTTFSTHGIPTGPTLNHLATGKRISYAARLLVCVDDKKKSHNAARWRLPRLAAGAENERDRAKGEGCAMTAGAAEGMPSDPMSWWCRR
jgi:hypothetical protein